MGNLSLKKFKMFFKSPAIADLKNILNFFKDELLLNCSSTAMIFLLGRNMAVTLNCNFVSYTCTLCLHQSRLVIIC